VPLFNTFDIIDICVLFVWHDSIKEIYYYYYYVFTACTDSNCATCSGGASTCTACKGGYSVTSGGLCISMYCLIFKYYNVMFIVYMTIW